MKNSMLGRALIVGLGVGALVRFARSRRTYSFAGKVVAITGGSRGLGLVLARQFIAKDARVAIIARDEEELRRAEEDLQRRGGQALGVRCDLSKKEDIEDAILQIVTHFGGLDVVVNNAGIIQVGPLEHMEARDFEQAMAIHFFGPLHTIFAALPHMKARGGGRIVNISSIGGKIAVPHLVPYCASKFALAGLSDGLRSELRRHNVYVTTVCPGLMRTGSPGNARFKGNNRKEYAWFAICDSLPILTMSAERAAAQIIRAATNGAPNLLLGVQTKAAVLANGLFPGAVAEMMAVMNKLLPSPDEARGKGSFSGWESESAWTPRMLTRLTKAAAAKNNEF